MLWKDGLFYDKEFNMWISPYARAHFESDKAVYYYGCSNIKNNKPGKSLRWCTFVYCPLNECVICKKLGGKKQVNYKCVCWRGLEKVTRDKYSIPDWMHGDMCMKCYGALTRFSNLCEQLYLLKKEIRLCKSKTRQTSENSYAIRLSA